LSEAQEKHDIDIESPDEIRGNIRKSIQQEIFRQLYYSERPESLCLSRYSRIGKFPMLIYSILVIVASIVLNFTMEKLDIAISTITLNTFLIGFSFCLILAILIRLLSLRIEKFFQNISVMKIGAGGLSLDLAKDGPDFEEAADEFIYYFKKTGCRIVVLEDLDRFKDPHIYEELRQLNMLINGAKHIHRKVVFIYALKDSLISEPESRTKLFDAIVPVVPFITQDNVLQKISRIFQQSGFNGTGVVEVCKVLARNIKDMRTIKAIHNTAVVIRVMISGGNNTKLRDAEIIAIAAIRELFPLQYEKLRKGESELDDIYKNCLENKKFKVNNLVNKIKRRKDVPNTMLHSAGEDLWSLIIQPLESDKNYTFSSAQRNSTPFTQQDLINEAFWKNFIHERSLSLTIVYTAPYYSNKQQNKTISIEHAQSASDNIKELVDLLQYDEDHYRTDLDDLLKQDVFQEMGGYDDSDDNSINIIKELLQVGAIDESYQLYLSPLSDISGSIELRSFRIQCLSRRTPNFSFKLSDDDINTILSEADLIDLQSPAFYNHYIISWLLAHKDQRLDIILNKNPKTVAQLMEFFNWECCQYEKQLSEDYGSIIMEGSLSSYIEDDYILKLTQKIAGILPEELLLMLSTYTTLSDTIGKEAVFIVAILSIPEPSKTKFSAEYIDIIGSFLDYYEDTAILNGGDLKLAELRVANNLPTARLELYHNDKEVESVLISNMLFEINETSLREISSDVLIQKLENDGLSSKTLGDIIENRKGDSKILTYCLERPDIDVSLNDQAVNAKLIHLAYRHKIKLQKEQIINLTTVLHDDYIIDLMLISDLLWNDYEDIFIKLGEPYKSIRLGKRPLLPNTDRSLSLIDRLKYFGVVSSGPSQESGSLRLSMKRQI